MIKRATNNPKHSLRRQMLALSSTLSVLIAAYLILPVFGWHVLEPRAQAATFTVTNTSDGNAGSLRDAIVQAINSAETDTITFSIPPNDPRHFYYANDGVAGTVSRSLIAVTPAPDDTTITDIDPDWPHSWYSIETAGFVGGSLINTEVTIDGLSQPGSVPNTNPSGPLNSVLKIEVTNSPTDGSCSRIFQTAFAAVVFRGLVINGCSQSSGAREIDFDFASDGSIAAGNYIGTDPSGTIGLGTGYGVHITQASSVTVGGFSPADRNLISANFHGIDANNGGASNFGFSGIQIIGNLIGTKRDAVSPLGNGLHPEQSTQREDGIRIAAINGPTSNNRIQNNVIAFNARWGVFLTSGGVGTGGNIHGNRILGNSIHSNGNIGINIDGNDGGPNNAVTPNDPCDADAGFNLLQNYPVIKNALISGSSIKIAGTLNGIPGGTYHLEFFASTAPDASYFGEGQTLLGTSTIDIPAGSCNGAFDVSLPLPAGAGNVITATATDANGNTSEFSAVYLAQSQNNSCTPRPDGLVSWYSAEGNVNDSQSENHGKFVLFPGAYTTGKVGQAFEVGRNGVDVIEVPDDPTLDLTNAFTIEMWVAPAEAGLATGQTFFISKGNMDRVDTQSYGILFSQDREIVNRVGNSSTLDQAVSATQIPLNAFTHVATTYDGSTLRVYINGVLDSSKSTSIGTLLDTSEPLVIGGALFNGSPIAAQAVIDEPSLYNRALSDSEIQSIFNAGSAGKCFQGSCAALGMSDSGSPDGMVYTPYSRTITASGGTGPYTYSLGAGVALPAGLSLNPNTGEISGSPTASGQTSVSVIATDANGCTGALIFTIVIGHYSCPPMSGPVVINGDLTIVGSTAATINLACITTVTGNLIITGNAAAGVLDLGSLTTVGGTINISDNTAAGNLDLSSLTAAGGTINISGNAAVGNLDLSSLSNVAGELNIDNNHSAETINLVSLTSVSGDLDLSNNTAAGNLDLGSLTGVSGELIIANNDSAEIINLSALTSVSGNLDISNNSSAGNLDLDSLTSAGGLDVSDNGACTSVTLGNLASVTGDLAVESCGTDAFNPGNASAGGETSLTTEGYSSISGTTATGVTTVGNTTAEAVMTVELPAGAFTAPVSFTITHSDPSTLNPEPGTSPSGDAVIDPIAAYQFTFGVPTLNQDATLTFDILLDNLDAATRAALLEALADGNATMATRGDAAGSEYQAFPLCASGETPTADGCVSVAQLDANGQPTTGTPAILRFSSVVGHFSTWAVVIVAPVQESNLFNGLLQPYPAPPHTAIPTFKRGSTVPLKFNWVNASGLVIDSAAANPVISIYPMSCSSETQRTVPITLESGASGGLRYDADKRMWIFNWSTKRVAAGCYSIRVTPGNAEYSAPTGAFPIKLVK